MRGGRIIDGSRTPALDSCAMRKLLIWVGVILAVLVGGKLAIDGVSHSVVQTGARNRVQILLDGLTDGGSYQNALGMWLEGGNDGLKRMSQDEYNMSVSGLKRWLEERRLSQPIGEFEIHDTALVREAEGLYGATVAVSCTVDGEPVVILVADGKRLEWGD